jgi:transcriptional regulator with XRE-family HTH domain
MESGRRIRRKHGSPIAQDPAAVRRARETAELQQKQLAQMLGISRQLMTDIESGHRSATPPVLRRIAEITGVDTDDLRHQQHEPECTCVARDSA